MFYWIENNIDQIGLSIFSGILLVLIIFILFRPWFYISSKIAYDDGVYKFKIINLTFVKCTDLNIFLRKTKEIDAYPKGKDVVYDIMDVNTDSFIYISGCLTGIFRSHRPNCIQIKVRNQDLKGIIANDGTYIELIVNARHGISNLQTTKKRTFKHTEYVKNGVWSSGFSTKIV